MRVDNEDRLVCKRYNVNVAVTKILRACVYVLDSSPPVVILAHSFCDVTKQSRVCVLSLVNIWHIFFSLNILFGHSISWLPIEGAFLDSVFKLPPWYLSVCIFQSHNLITFLDIDFSSSYKNCLIFVGNPFDYSGTSYDQHCYLGWVRVLQSCP